MQDSTDWRSLGPDHDRTTGSIKALADLYDEWHAAEPDGGYDAKAAKWRAKLPAMNDEAEESATEDGDE